MAFRVFMFLIPYVFVVVVGLGLAGDAADKSAQEVARAAGIGGLAAQAIVQADSASTASRWTVLVIGGFALFLGARSAVKVLMAIYAMTWEVPIRKVERLSRAAGALIAVITLALMAVVVIDGLRDTSEPLGLTFMVLYTAVPFALWLYVSSRLPHAQGAGWRDLAPGALLVALGIQALHFFTVLWITHSIESKTETYGAIGAALALLLWAFVLGRVLILSAVLNSAIWYRSHTAGTPDRAIVPPASPPNGGPGPTPLQGDMH
jgi:membrane protein